MVFYIKNLNTQNQCKLKKILDYYINVHTTNTIGFDTPTSAHLYYGWTRDKYTITLISNLLMGNNMHIFYWTTQKKKTRYLITRLLTTVSRYHEPKTICTCHFRRMMNFLSLSVLRITQLISMSCCASHLCFRHSLAVSLFLQNRFPLLSSKSIEKTSTISTTKPYSFLLTNNALIKSLAFCEMASNASSSKSNSAFVMLVNVSASLSPMNGDNPDNLRVKRDKVTKKKEKVKKRLKCTDLLHDHLDELLIAELNYGCLPWSSLRFR